MTQQVNVRRLSLRRSAKRDIETTWHHIMTDLEKLSPYQLALVLDLLRKMKEINLEDSQNADQSSIFMSSLGHKKESYKGL